MHRGQRPSLGYKGSEAITRGAQGTEVITGLLPRLGKDSGDADRGTGISVCTDIRSNPAASGINFQRPWSSVTVKGKQRQSQTSKMREEQTNYKKNVYLRSQNPTATASEFLLMKVSPCETTSTLGPAPDTPVSKVILLFRTL